MRIHPNTLQGFRDHKMKMQQIKEDRKQKLVDLLEYCEPTAMKKIAAELDITPITTRKYIVELIESGVLEKVGKHKLTKYQLRSPSESLKLI
jgi:predicted ArsR family transcriptional regulator